MPSVFEMDSSFRPVSLFVAVTVAPGTVAPCESFTAPVMVPYRICALAVAAVKQMVSTMRLTDANRIAEKRVGTFTAVPPPPDRVPVSTLGGYTPKRDLCGLL